MKKSASLEQNRVRQLRAGGGGGRKRAATVATAEGVKLSPARKGEPIGLLEEHFRDSETHAVSFEYFNSTAREVLVAGSFNGWQPKATPMTEQRGGKWSAEILLPPGQYEYRFVVDGQWQDDPMAARFVANSFGGLNCVVEVKPMETPATRRP
jgi:5'-AMP-activated protein kinase regulatory beta subunit